MSYTKELVKQILNKMKEEINRATFIIILNSKEVREGKFMSLNKDYIKIKNKINGIHKISIKDIANISTIIT